MQTDTEIKIYDVINKYETNCISLLEALKILVEIPYTDRDELSDELNDFLQTVDLMYEDYIEGFFDLDEKLFIDSISKLLKK